MVTAFLDKKYFKSFYSFFLYKIIRMLRHPQKLRLWQDQCSQLRGYISTNWVMPVPGPRPLPGSHRSLWYPQVLPPSNLRLRQPGLLHRRLVPGAQEEASSDDNKINLQQTRLLLLYSKLRDLLGAGSPHSTVGRGLAAVVLGKFAWPWVDNWLVCGDIWSADRHITWIFSVFLVNNSDIIKWKSVGKYTSNWQQHLCFI